MFGILLMIYTVFLSLIFLFLLGVSLLPSSKMKYATRKNYRPKVLVIMPCKGKDIDLVANLKAAQGQSYANYRLVAVVDSKKDLAFKPINTTKTECIISDKKYGMGSGKVGAIATALKRYQADVYVILDSDVLVGERWLELLIAPLADKSFGISTAFPVFQPKAGFWSRVKHAWGYVGFGLMESERTRFGWGGSLAFKKELVNGKYFDYFADSISDDIAITNLCKKLSMRLAYVPQANPIVYTDDDFGRFMEWSTRQTAFSIRGNSILFYYGVFFYSASILLFISGIVLGLLVSPVFLVFLLPFILGARKIYIRSDGSLEVLAIYPLINPMYLFNLLAASGMKSVQWRGRSYNISKIEKPK